MTYFAEGVQLALQGNRHRPTVAALRKASCVTIVEGSDLNKQCATIKAPLKITYSAEM